MVGREAMQANSQVCLLRYGAVQDAMVGWEAKQAHSAACLRWYSAMPEAMVGRGSKAGKLASLPALV